MIAGLLFALLQLSSPEATQVASAGQQAQPVPKPAAPSSAPNTPQGQPSSPGATPPSPANPSAQPPAPEIYTYQPAGRRDPFLSLVGTGREASTATRRTAEGPSAMAVGEISVRGVMQSRGSLVAMIQGPDNKTYIVRQGDKLLDGVIKSVTPQGLIVVQEVNDPLSLVKQREVRKFLRGLEDVK
jgi:type IV pilus assembly protein PilP